MVLFDVLHMWWNSNQTHHDLASLSPLTTLLCQCHIKIRHGLDFNWLVNTPCTATSASGPFTLQLSLIILSSYLGRRCRQEVMVFLLIKVYILLKFSHLIKTMYESNVITLQNFIVQYCQIHYKIERNGGPFCMYHMHDNLVNAINLKLSNEPYILP